MPNPLRPPKVTFSPAYIYSLCVFALYRLFLFVIKKKGARPTAFLSSFSLLVARVAYTFIATTNNSPQRA